MLPRMLHCVGREQANKGTVSERTGQLEPGQRNAWLVEEVRGGEAPSELAQRDAMPHVEEVVHANALIPYCLNSHCE